MKVNAKIRQQIYDHMKEKGISQVEVAQKLGITPQSVNQVLRGDRSQIRFPLIAILDVLDLELVVQPKE